MRNTCWLFAILFAISTAGLIYKFMISGSTIETSDNRTAILISESERNLVLGEMRHFLETVQTITSAAVNDDMESVSQAARKVGMGAQEGVPTSLIGKLPIGFKTLGFDTHKRFDQLALDAEQFGDSTQVLSTLGELMHNCTGCHAAFRLEIEPQ